MLSQIFYKIGNATEKAESRLKAWASTKLAWVLFTLITVIFVLFVMGWLISSFFSNPVVAGAIFAGMPLMMLIQLIYGIFRK